MAPTRPSAARGPWSSAPRRRTGGAALRLADAALGRDRLTVLAYDACPPPHHLDWIARAFRPVALADLVALLLDVRRMPERAVLITIDGADRQTARAALAALQPRGIPAVLFATTHQSDGGPPTDWEAAARLHDAGIAVEPRTATWRSLEALDDAGLREAVERAARTIERRTGRAATAFAYPPDMPGAPAPRIVRALRQVRIRIAVTMLPGAVPVDVVRRDPLYIPRVRVSGDDDLHAVALKAAGLTGPGSRARALARAARRIGCHAARASR